MVRPPHTDESSLDENVIDFESRKAKEQRARAELRSGRYRQPGFIKSSYLRARASMKTHHSRLLSRRISDVRCSQPPGADDKQPLAESVVGVGGGQRSTATLPLPLPPAAPSSVSSPPSSAANVEPRRVRPHSASGASHTTTATSPMREICVRGGFTAASFDVTSIGSTGGLSDRGADEPEHVGRKAPPHHICDMRTDIDHNLCSAIPRSERDRTGGQFDDQRERRLGGVVIGSGAVRAHRSVSGPGGPLSGI